MPATVSRFVNACQEIVDAKPTYQKGCSDKRKCDCIGMLKYGLRQNGITLTTTGTNYTFRHHVTNIRKITNASVLKIGDVAFKALRPGDDGYDLPDKYQNGGSEYNGDLTDYNHIGVVKSVDPLQIIHMTGPTAKTDTSIGRWKFAAELKSKYLDYGTGSTDDAEKPAGATAEKPPSADASETSMIVTATIISDNGKPVKMRAKPSVKCRMYDELPVGTVLTVTVYRSDWCTVTYKNRKNWFMMTNFLSFG